MTDEELIELLRDRAYFAGSMEELAADRIEQLVRERDEAEAKLAKAVEALQFYAKEEWPQNYPCGVLYAAGNDTSEFKTHLDYGDKARAVLAELEKSE